MLAKLYNSLDLWETYRNNFQWFFFPNSETLKDSEYEPDYDYFEAFELLFVRDRRDENGIAIEENGIFSEKVF